MRTIALTLLALLLCGTAVQSAPPTPQQVQLRATKKFLKEIARDMRKTLPRVGGQQEERDDQD